MDAGTIDQKAVQRYLKPESDLEVFILSQPEWLKGTLWGEPDQATQKVRCFITLSKF